MEWRRWLYCVFVFEIEVVFVFVFGCEIEVDFEIGGSSHCRKECRVGIAAWQLQLGLWHWK
jgi:hypothetical protein